MKQTDFINHGVLSICNYGGMEIMLDEMKERVLVRMFGKIEPRWKKLYCTMRGRTYFKYGNVRYYLDEFMRP